MAASGALLPAEAACEIERIVGYQFSDKRLLATAFTHSSLINELFYGDLECNERLEFLGDRLVGLAVADKLYASGTLAPGVMTDVMQALVSKEPLAAVVERLNLYRFMRLGGSMKKTQPSVKNLSDLFEAVTAAIYLDGGYDMAVRFVRAHLPIDEAIKSVPVAGAGKR